MLILLGAYIYFSSTGSNIAISNWIVALTVFLIVMALLGLGFGIIISSLTTKYRDLRFLLGFGIQLWMYASPVIYPLSILPEKAKFYMSLNPVAPVIEGFRYIFLGKGYFNLGLLGYSIAIAVTIFLIGVALFHRVEKTFMDTV